MLDSTAARLAHRADLERRFDGPIPAHLLETRSADEHRAGHVRAMIRFNQSRIADFSETLEKVKAMPEGAVRDAWLKSTTANIAFHRDDLARHEAELALTTPEQLAAE